MNILAEATMNVPVGWVLASGATLAGAISTLAGLIYKSQQKQIDALGLEIANVRRINESQADTIKQQNQIILNLQQDITDLKVRLRKYEANHTT